MDREPKAGGKQRQAQQRVWALGRAARTRGCNHKLLLPRFHEVGRVLVVENHPGGQRRRAASARAALEATRCPHTGAAGRARGRVTFRLRCWNSSLPRKSRTSPRATRGHSDRTASPFRQRLDGDGGRAEVFELPHKVVRPCHRALQLRAAFCFTHRSDPILKKKYHEQLTNTTRCEWP